MANRWEVERALRGSTLPPSARLVAWALLSRTDVSSAAIPAEHSVSLTTIGEDTGLGRSTVARELNRLEAEGWVVRTRPPVSLARSKKAKTRYQLRAPASPRAGLVPERDYPPSPGAGLALVPERDSPSPRAGHNQTSTRTKPEQRETPAPRRRADPYSQPGFAEFWDVYPSKKAKADAAKAYRAALARCEGDPAPILKGAVAYRDDPARAAKFTAHPGTWLRGERWLDESGPLQSTTDRRVAAAREAGRRVAQRLDPGRGGTP